MTHLRAREIAEQLHCHVSTVYGWRNRGLLRSRKVGGLVVFDREEVERFQGVRERLDADVDEWLDGERT